MSRKTECLTCMICIKVIVEGEQVASIEEGNYCSSEIVDRETHHVVHTRCFYDAVAKAAQYSRLITATAELLVAGRHLNG